MGRGTSAMLREETVVITLAHIPAALIRGIAASATFATMPMMLTRTSAHPGSILGMGTSVGVRILPAGDLADGERPHSPAHANLPDHLLLTPILPWHRPFRDRVMLSVIRFQKLFVARSSRPSKKQVSSSGLREPERRAGL